MKKWLTDKIKNNLLLKLTSANAIGVLIRMVAGFASSKAIAIFAGPEGYALVGYLRNVMNVIQQIPLLGTSNGIIRYTAEHKEKDEELKKLFSTMMFSALFVSILLACALFIGADYWNQKVFKEKDYAFIFKVIAVTIPFFALNMLCLHLLNGLSRYRKFLIINAAGAVLAALLTVCLAWQFKTDGVLIAFVVTPSVILFIALYYLKEDAKHIFSARSKFFSLGVLKKLSKYMLMALVSVITVNLIDFLVKDHIEHTIGLKEVGYWESMKRISNYYLIFVTSLMTLYVLPKLSKDHSALNFRKTIFDFYKTVMPFFAIGLVLVFFLKYYIIRIVLTKEFLAVQELFFWQLIGDFIKIGAVVMAYRFHAKGMLRLFILTELASVIVIYTSSIFFIDKFGIEGVVMAHSVSYAIYFLVVLFIFRKQLFARRLPNV